MATYSKYFENHLTEEPKDNFGRSENNGSAVFADMQRFTKYIVNRCIEEIKDISRRSENNGAAAFADYLLTSSRVKY